MQSDAKGVFSTIGHIQEGILILLLLVKLPHCQAGLRDSPVYKKEYCLLRRQLNPLPDDPHKLSHSYVRWNQVLPLVNVHNLRA